MRQSNYAIYLQPPPPPLAPPPPLLFHSVCVVLLWCGCIHCKLCMCVPTAATYPPGQPAWPPHQIRPPQTLLQQHSEGHRSSSGGGGCRPLPDSGLLMNIEINWNFLAFHRPKGGWFWWQLIHRLLLILLCPCSLLVLLLLWSNIN